MRPTIILLAGLTATAWAQTSTTPAPNIASLVASAFSNVPGFNQTALSAELASATSNGAAQLSVLNSVVTAEVASLTSAAATLLPSDQASSLRTMLASLQASVSSDIAAAVGTSSPTSTTASTASAGMAATTAAPMAAVGAGLGLLALL